MTVRVYHGTGASAWSSIEVEGLRPAAAMLGTAVFAAVDPDVAARYAAGRLMPHGVDDLGVVLSFDVPASTRHGAGTYLVERVVAPHEIEVVRWVEPGDCRPWGAPVMAAAMSDLGRSLASVTAAAEALASSLAVEGA